MTIFLTGGNGDIGSAIKQILEQNGINVLSPSSKEIDLKKDFTINHTVDGFIHCAGVNVLENHTSLNYNKLQEIFNINTFSFIKLCSQLTFTPGSNIIAIGSLYSTSTKENRIQYTMSKHALYGAVKTIALEKSKDNIKANMVSPGFVDTKLTRKNNSTERIKQLNSLIPLGLVTSWEIANFCLYLIRYNNFITGQNIKIDGGYSLKGI